MSITPPDGLIEKTKKASDFANSLKAIVLVGVSGIALLFGAFKIFDDKLDTFDNMQRDVKEINDTLLVASNTLQQTALKVDRLSENIMGVDRRLTLAEDKLANLDVKIKRASQVNEQIPFRFIDSTDTGVADGKPGDYVRVHLAYDKFRTDCMPKIVRIVRDSSGVLHDVTRNASVPDNQVAPPGTNQSSSFLVQLPPANQVKYGEAKYQSRIQYTCNDGGSFFITSPWISFTIIDPRQRTK